jgi:class 3 adenylate cyclase/ketosteroid isomerase-like protein
MAENRRTCTSCGTPNEEDARFCEGCGASLSRECATCGMEASATARFCRGCGAPLDGQMPPTDFSAAGPSRKTVTVMFADLAGSTTFEENVDAETAREVIGRYHDLLRSTAERHRAGVTKYIGDGFMAVWGVPEIGPDDAAHAIDAAVELQERFVDLAAQVAKTHRAELALRVAVNTGEVVVGDGDADLVGDALNVGARLEAECPRGRVVVGEETWRATRGRYSYESLGQVQVKGRSAPVAVYQWLDRQSEPADAAPFVGRSNEVRRLQAVLDDAIASRAARLVTVVGDPGVGKSRLAAEFTAAQGDVCVIEARCAVEGTVALRPIVEVLRVRDLETDIPASVPERDRLLRDLNGLVAGVAGSVEENFWALRRFVEVLASGGSILLVLDDIQWAGTLLLDFIEHLVEWVQEVPVLVLALARPELREIRPELITVSRWVSEAIPLNGLDARATAELAANVLGAAQLPDELLRRLPSSTGGNPLFVRELIGMLAHDGVLVEQPSGWRLTIDVDAIAIPPTIHALLASRLERLDAADRRVLEIAAVVGSDFSVGTVRALAGTGADGVKRSLDRLRRLDLAQPSGAYTGDEPVWRFHHVLIRDVAYRRVLKSDRADLHERLADWVAAGGASVAFDTDELIARHLEAARTYRLELGHDNEHTGDLALRAARHYVASARRALDRDELVSAGTQAARGAALANADPAAHAELLLTGCEAFLSAGDVAAGAPLVDELERISDASLEPWAACYRCQFIVYTAPERLLEVDARLLSAIDEFGRRNDAAGLAKAHRVRASARFRLGRVGDAEVDLFEALIAARQSGDHRQITAALGAAPGAALWGPSPVPKAGGRCLDVVRMQRMTTAAPSLEATSMRHLAVLELLRGRPDKARTMLGDARQLVEDLGLRHGLMETELFAGIIESMEGDPVAAEPHFRTALEGLDALGVGADAGLAAALLARSVLAQGRIDEADRHATESERLAGRNLKTAIAWRAVRAEILAARGRHAEAAAVARDAVTVAAGTDLVIDHADACLALSRVLAAADDAKGARIARDDADRLYAAKEVASTIVRRTEPVASEVEGPVQPDLTTSRLAVANESCRRVDEFENAMRAHHVDGVIACYADAFVVDDRRRISGYSLRDRDPLREALTRLFEDYTRFDFRVIAVRGQRLNLIWSRFSDEDGNQTATLDVGETDGDGRFRYHGRFDEDDFEGAYLELERRYYAGEGAAFAECANAATLAPILLNRNEFDRFITELCTPDLHVENRSRSAIPDRSAKGLIASFRDLQALTSVARTWISVARWFAPTVSMVRLEREALGHDGEEYAWTRILVCEFRDGRFASMCEFDIEDEESAFAYAEERARETPRRLAVMNRSCEYLPSFLSALHVHDVDGTLNWFSDDFVYDDRRKLGGDPVVGREAMRAAIERIFGQYNHFDIRVLAVRGQRSHLLWTRWSDDDGNETTTFYVNETGDDGRIVYHARYDEDDFEGAYREFEGRYYAGEGAAFADGGTLGAEWVIALNHGDFDLVFDELTAPGMRVENRSQSLFGDRSATELRATFEDLNDTVASARIWVAATCWVSPELVIARFEREAMGQDGEIYAWTRIHVAEIRDGQVASSCRFEIDDEEAAFAYAEARLRASTSRLAVANRATQTATHYWNAMRAFDVDGALECCADQLVYDDRRHVSGDPVRSRADLRAACERLFAQYTQFERRTLAVRGENLHLTWSRSYNDAGYETTCLHVSEIGNDGRFIYEGRFDEDDFETAYRELEKRYYTGEASEYAVVGALQTEWMIAVNAGDFDRLFGGLSTPDLRVENRNRAFFPDRSASEFRESLEELSGMVGKSRTWNSALRWLSPSVCICRNEREAIGSDDEQYSWSRVSVAEIRHGRVASLCHFAFDDEEAAFAYAEERVQATTSRLSLKNLASETADAIGQAMRAADADGALAYYADTFTFDDRRRLSGDPVEGAAAMRAAAKRVLEQYTQFETHTLAVRGEHLHLFRNRFQNNDGFETTYLFLYEIGDDGHVLYEGRFDEDDFEGAYRELEKRYFAGEGAAFAETGSIGTEITLALSAGDLDRAFGDLVAPDFRIENRSSSVFSDRSATELRATFEDLHSMVTSVRTWQSAACWLSPNYCVGRTERDAIGPDGEQYAWTRLHVFELRNGRLASMCEFELGDEDQAFAYAEERVRADASRLALTNRASPTIEALARTIRAADVDGTVGWYADTFVFDDRRRLSGDPVRGIPELRAAIQRIVDQYRHFDWRTLAVRGTWLHLSSSRWSDDAGNETGYLHLREVDGDGRFTYEARFDADDFEGAYSELDRRYYDGEGAAFAEAGATVTDYMIALHRGDLDRAVGELSAPDFRIENRSRSVFGDRSAAEFRAGQEELNAMVTSERTYNSAMCWLSPAVAISRFEREAIGRDGERYSWSFIVVSEVHDGRVTRVRQFELDDEEAAFAYAEERARATPTRLAVINSATQRVHALIRAALRREADAMADCYSEGFEYDDRRKLSGNPIRDLRATAEQILSQYSQFEACCLAVRGKRLQLARCRWSNDSGFETTHLIVNEIGEDGRFVYEGRFDEDDFEAAYRELTRRHYTGEGAAIADTGPVVDEFTTAMNRAEFDRILTELTVPEFRLENRSRSIFPDRSAPEMIAGFEETGGMVVSTRTWHSALCWQSPSIFIGGFEREATGADGERYAWGGIDVAVLRDGKVASVCLFEADDEDAAFAYAEERVRLEESR